METTSGSVEEPLFTAQELWEAAEAGANVRDNCIAAGWAIKAVQNNGVSDQFASEYYSALARHFK